MKKRMSWTRALMVALLGPVGLVSRKEEVMPEMTKTEFIVMDNIIGGIEKRKVVKTDSGWITISVPRAALCRYAQKLAKETKRMGRVGGKCKYGELNLTEVKHLWRVLMIADIKAQREKINERFSL